jgi:hypothetical protein
MSKCTATSKPRSAPRPTKKLNPKAEPLSNPSTSTALLAGQAIVCFAFFIFVEQLKSVDSQFN